MKVTVVQYTHKSIWQKYSTILQSSKTLLLQSLLKNKAGFLYFQCVLFASLEGSQEARHGCFKNVINIWYLGRVSKGFSDHLRDYIF